MADQPKMIRAAFGFLVCTCVLGFVPQQGAAQRLTASTSAAGIVAGVLEGGQPVLHRLLRQVHGPEPRARLDSIALGLVEGAIL
jgi:hypothetical protein